MSHGIFTERNRKPEDGEVIARLASARPVWQDLVDFLEVGCKSKGELKFYGKNYGWALRFNKSGRSLAALYPADDGFTVQIILDLAQAETALGLGISPEIKRVVRETKCIHEGKWVFIKVASRDQADDVKQLIMVRAGKL